MSEILAYELSLAAYFVVDKPHASFSHGDISTIAFLLDKLQKPWHRSPKTYIVLRAIQQLDIMEKLLDSGFDDGLFPVESSGPGLPGFLDAKVRQKIIQNQHLILSATWDLESGIHCSNLNTTPPFEFLRVLGSGAFGQVYKIKSQDTGREYAHKTIAQSRLSYPSRIPTEALLGEIRIIKSLRHDHVIQYIGSYTTTTSLGLIMSPVADYDLAAYLDITRTATEYHPTLRTFFGCLANALLYLHSQNVRHRDITPRNVLVLNARVLFTDFGLSRDSLDTTSGPTAFSSPYCAQEVAEFKQRNESADIWSLGCVFLEMFTSLQGHKEGWLRAFYLSNGTKKPYFRNNNPATRQILRIWRASVASMEAKPLVWIEAMLVSDREKRPSAAGVAEMIMLDRETSYMYSCNGCLTGGAQSTSVTTMTSLTPPSARSISRDDEGSVPTQTLQASSPVNPSLGPSGREVGLGAMVSKRNEALVRKQRSTIWYDAPSEPANTLSERATTTQVTQTEQNANTEQVEGLSQAEIPTKLPEEETSASIKSIFGLTLENAVQLAGQDIGFMELTIRGEKTQLVGRVPIIVAKCVEKILGGNSNWIFAEVLHGRTKQKPDFLDQLKQTFDAASDYGLSLRWEGYRAVDAANLLLSYLESLPELLIPDPYVNQLPTLKLKFEKAYAPSPLYILGLYSNVLVTLPTEKYHLLLCLIAVLCSRAEARQNFYSKPGWFNWAAKFCSHKMCSDPRQGLAILTLLIVNADYFLSVAKGSPKSDEQWKDIIKKGTESQQREKYFTKQMEKDIAAAKRAAESSSPRKDGPAAAATTKVRASSVGTLTSKNDHRKSKPLLNPEKKVDSTQSDSEGGIRSIGKGRSADLSDKTAMVARWVIGAKMAVVQRQGQDDQTQGDRFSKERPSKTFEVNGASATNTKKVQSAPGTDDKSKTGNCFHANETFTSLGKDLVTRSTMLRNSKTSIDSGIHTAHDQDRATSFQAKDHSMMINMNEDDIIASREEGLCSEESRQLQTHQGSSAENWDLYELDEPRRPSDEDTQSRRHSRAPQTLETVETRQRDRSWRRDLEVGASEQGTSRTASAFSLASAERLEFVELPRNPSPETKAEGRERSNMSPVARTISGNTAPPRRRGWREKLHSRF